MKYLIVLLIFSSAITAFASKSKGGGDIILCEVDGKTEYYLADTFELFYGQRERLNRFSNSSVAQLEVDIVKFLKTHSDSTIVKFIDSTATIREEMIFKAFKPSKDQQMLPDLEDDYIDLSDYPECHKRQLAIQSVSKVVTEQTNLLAKLSNIEQALYRRLHEPAIYRYNFPNNTTLIREQVRSLAEIYELLKISTEYVFELERAEKYLEKSHEFIDIAMDGIDSTIIFRNAEKCGESFTLSADSSNGIIRIEIPFLEHNPRKYIAIDANPRGQRPEDMSVRLVFLPEDVVEDYIDTHGLRGNSLAYQFAGLDLDKFNMFSNTIKLLRLTLNWLDFGNSLEFLAITTLSSLSGWVMDSDNPGSIMIHARGSTHECYRFKR